MDQDSLNELEAAMLKRRLIERFWISNARDQRGQGRHQAGHRGVGCPFERCHALICRSNSRISALSLPSNAPKASRHARATSGIRSSL